VRGPSRLWEDPRLSCRSGFLINPRRPRVRLPSWADRPAWTARPTNSHRCSHPTTAQSQNNKPNHIHSPRFQLGIISSPPPNCTLNSTRTIHFSVCSAYQILEPNSDPDLDRASGLANSPAPTRRARLLNQTDGRAPSRPRRTQDNHVRDFPERQFTQEIE